MRTIIITEAYDKIFLNNKSHINYLTTKEAFELKTYFYNDNLGLNYILWDVDSIRIINYVGYIRLSSVSIEILPKISNENIKDNRKILLNMLKVSGDLKVTPSELSYINTEQEDLFEIYAYLFSSKLIKEFLKGFYNEYIENFDNLSILKGKININNQIKNIILQNANAACHYEEFVSDNPLNQYFKFVINYLIKKVNKIKTIENLRNLSYMLSDVSNIYNISKINNINFNRLNERFLEPYILSKQIINKTSSLGDKSKNMNFGILIPMEKLFEKYIGIIAKKLYKEQVLLQTSEKYLLINDFTSRVYFRLIPDIIYTTSNGTQIIMDTKWKLLRSGQTPSREDLFQMYAYLTRYTQCNNVIILYPYNVELKKSGELLDSWYIENDQNKKIIVTSIDCSSNDKCMEDIIKIINTTKYN